MSVIFSAAVVAPNFEVEAKTREAGGYGRAGDGRVWRRGSLPRPALALAAPGFHRLWRRSGSAP